MEQARNISISILFLILSVIAYDSYPYLVGALRSVETAANQAKLTAVRVREVADLQAHLIGQPGAVRSVGLLLRSGDNLYRSTVKLEKLLDNLTLIADQVNTQTLPRIHVMLDTGTQTIRITVNELMQLRTDLHDTLFEINLTVIAAKAILSDPSFGEILKRSGSLLANANLTVEEANQSLPELLKLLTEIESNIARGTSEVASLVAQFNQPVTKKQKVFRALLQILAVSLPHIIRR